MYNNLFRYNIGRSVHNPLGDTTKVSVRHSNVMTSRVVLVLYIYLALGIYWLIEQPLSSVFEHLPRFKWLCTITKIYKLTFRMDRFGSDTPKGTVLYSPRPFVRDILDYPAPREVPVEEKQVVIKTERPDGTVSVSGGRDLKKTQVYTRGFGEAVPILYIYYDNNLYTKFRPEFPELAGLPKLEMFAKRHCRADFTDGCPKPVFQGQLDFQFCMTHATTIPGPTLTATSVLQCRSKANLNARNLVSPDAPIVLEALVLSDAAALPGQQNNPKLLSMPHSRQCNKTIVRRWISTRAL